MQCGGGDVTVCLRVVPMIPLKLQCQPVTKTETLQGFSICIAGTERQSVEGRTGQRVYHVLSRADCYRDS